MSWKCDIVTDLLPLYYDNAESKASKRLVREHLKECADCRAIYRKYRPKHDLAVETPFSNKEEDFTLLAKRVRNRRLLLWTGFLSYVGATLGILALYSIQKDRRLSEYKSFFSKA